MYMCVSMWRHVIWYDCTCTKDTRSKSALLIKTRWILWIPNLLTVLSFHQLSFTAYHIRQWNRGEQPMGMTCSQSLALLGKASKTVNELTVLFFSSPSRGCGQSDKAKPGTLSEDVTSSSAQRGLSQRLACALMCVHLGVFSPPSPSNGVQSGLLSALRRRAVTALFSTCFRLRDTQLCTQCVCVQAHQAGADSSLRSWFIMHLNPYLSSLCIKWLLKVVRVIRRGKVDSAMIETKSQTQRVRWGSIHFSKCSAAFFTNCKGRVNDHVWPKGL